jgi:hypothetical protein
VSPGVGSDDRLLGQRERHRLHVERGPDTMNDYFASSLAREHQADLLREVAHDELAALARRARSDGQTPAASRAHLPHPTQDRLWTLLHRLGPARLAGHTHRP